MNTTQIVELFYQGKTVSYLAELVKNQNISINLTLEKARLIVEQAIYDDYTKLNEPKDK